MVVVADNEEVLVGVRSGAVPPPPPVGVLSVVVISDNLGIGFIEDKEDEDDCC